MTPWKDVSGNIIAGNSIHDEIAKTYCRYSTLIFKEELGKLPQVGRSIKKLCKNENACNMAPQRSKLQALYETEDFRLDQP